jgi:hypothetical protein
MVVVIVMDVGIPFSVKSFYGTRYSVPKWLSLS